MIWEPIVAGVLIGALALVVILAVLGANPAATTLLLVVLGVFLLVLVISCLPGGWA